MQLAGMNIKEQCCEYIYIYSILVLVQCHNLHSKNEKHEETFNSLKIY